jgi:hypothetical protein
VVDELGPLARATTATIRRKLVHLPSRIASFRLVPDAAPAHRVALGERLDRSLHRFVRPTTAGGDDLTNHLHCPTKQWTLSKQGCMTLRATRKDEMMGLPVGRGRRLDLGTP